MSRNSNQNKQKTASIITISQLSRAECLLNLYELHRPKRKMRQTFYKKNKKIKFSNIFLVM